MSCVTSPTATLFTTFTTDSVSTSFSDSVSTLAPTTTTIQSVSCVPTTNGTVTTSSCSTVDSVSTIAGGTTTVQVPVVTTIPITSSSATATEFTTSCETSAAPTSTTTVVLTTAIATTVTFQSSFTSDGTVVYTSGTSTTFTTVETTSTSVITPTSSPSSDSSETGAIVGGAVGGAVGAVILALLAWLFFRRKRRYDFDDELFLHEATHDDHPKNVLRKNGEKPGVDIDSEPRPYLYGALSSAGPSTAPHTPSTEGAPPVAYRGPPSPPMPSPYQVMPGKVLPPPPHPMPSQSSASSPSAYSAHPSAQLYAGNSAANASASTFTTSGAGGYDQRRPLQVVNASAPVLSYPAGVPSQTEKAQVYLHPDRGYVTVPERPEGSGSSSYVPRRPPTPVGLGSILTPPLASPPAPQAVPQSEASRAPFQHKDAGRAPVAGRASESEAPPAYTE